MTESGRIYDMDLSAFQFGVFSPFPYIMPVLYADATAFNGMSDRDRILGVNLPDFEDSVLNLMQGWINLINSMPWSKGDAKIETLLNRFDDMCEQVLSDPSLRTLANYGGAGGMKFYWETVKSIPTMNV